jgi:hypothetical protein
MIRSATPADAEGIFRVHTSAIRGVATTHYTSEQIEAWAGRLSPASYSDPIGHKILLVAVSGLAQLTLDASLNSVPFYEQASYKWVRSMDHELAPGVCIPCTVMRKEFVSRGSS